MIINKVQGKLRCMMSANEPCYTGIVTRKGEQHSSMKLVNLGGEHRRQGQSRMMWWGLSCGKGGPGKSVK